MVLVIHLCTDVCNLYLYNVINYLHVGDPKSRYFWSSQYIIIRYCYKVSDGAYPYNVHYNVYVNHKYLEAIWTDFFFFFFGYQYTTFWRWIYWMRLLPADCEFMRVTYFAHLWLIFVIEMLLSWKNNRQSSSSYAG